MLTIALIRPGESEYDSQGRVQGNLDVPLSVEGQRQVERVALELGGADLEVVYGPECEPAWESTQRLASMLGVKAKPIADMQNLDHGLWQGLLIDDVKRKHPKVYRQWQENPASVCPPEGETLQEAQERIQTCVAKLLKKHKQGRIGLVMPEPLASLVRAHFGQIDLGDLWHAGADRPAWEWIEARPASTIER
jgi:broad specificity phosphatase PhoE